jgi:Tfp pilus assembly protein PilX
MGKRGVALILALLVTLVLSILLGSFFLRITNENQLVSRYVNSARAFWLAEAGVAEGIRHLPNPTSGCIGTANDCYSVNITSLSAKYYQINSTGTVTLPSAGTITRSLNVVVQTEDIDPNKFQYAIGTTVTLVRRGSVTINPSTSWEENAIINFSDLFECSKEDMRSYATHVYDTVDDTTAINGITWIEPSGGSLNISGNLTGSGILVIAGNVHISGTFQFDGIIYVIGDLTITGNVTLTGSVLAESNALIDTTTEIKGNVTLNYDSNKITDALNPLRFMNPEIVSWKET